MKLSEPRISHLAHRIVAALRDEHLADVENERAVLFEIKRVLAEEVEKDAAIDAAVRKKIASLSRHVPPGSREWDVLYQTYAAQERRRRRT